MTHHFHPLFVGILSRNVGHAMTYKIPRDKSLTISHQSNLCSAANPSDPGPRLDPLAGENLPQSSQIVKSAQEEDNEDLSDDQVKPMICFDTGDLVVGRIFLMEEDDDGLRSHACVIKVLEDHKQNVADNPVLKKFKCLVGEDEVEKILSYNEVMQHVEKDDDDGETFWKCKRISGHEGPLTKTHSSWKGHPVTCAICVKDNGLLDTDGWKRFRSLAKRAKKMLRIVNQSKLRSYKTCKKHMCGIETPQNCEDCIRLNELHGNDKWQNTTKLGMGQLHEQDALQDKGVGTTPGEGLKKIQVHLVHAVKHDGCHKARLCTNGNLTEMLVNSVCSGGVISLKSLPTVIFLAGLNGLEAWATCIGNTCLKAETSEKVFIIAGPKLVLFVR
jgi:hypothetical protein